MAPRESKTPSSKIFFKDENAWASLPFSNPARAFSGCSLPAGWTEANFAWNFSRFSAVRGAPTISSKYSAERPSTTLFMSSRTVSPSPVGQALAEGEPRCWPGSPSLQLATSVEDAGRRKNSLKPHWPTESATLAASSAFDTVGGALFGVAAAKNDFMDAVLLAAETRARRSALSSSPIWSARASRLGLRAARRLRGEPRPTGIA
jgi:hypothetical protein